MPTIPSSCCLCLVAFLAGCTKEAAESCIDGFCNTPGLPFCDVDGSLEGEPLVCVAVECEPNAFKQCRGANEALICNSSGTTYDVSQCELGCDEALGGCVVQASECTPNTVSCGTGTIERCDANGNLTTEACGASCISDPEPHCAYLEPMFLPDICDVPASVDRIEIGNLSTNLDSACNGGVVTQPGGPEICVVRARTIVVPSVIGDSRVDGQRALALVADELVAVQGTLDIGANNASPGPGVSTLRTSGTSGGTGYDGSAGAGLATRGGSGGSRPGGFGNAGGPAIDVDALAEVVGGFYGMSACTDSFNCRGTSLGTLVGSGGGGGGAATIIACRGRVEVSGTIDAGGGGGVGGGTNIVGDLLDGGGGGSGGIVSLQGLSISVTGSVFANGGAGGNGRPLGGAPGLFGADGERAVAAATAPQASGSEGEGGAGGFANAPPTSGSKSNGGTDSGGGGSVGAFMTFAPAASPLEITPIAQSPAIRPKRVVNVR